MALRFGASGRILLVWTSGFWLILVFWHFDILAFRLLVFRHSGILAFGFWLLVTIEMK